MAAGAARARQRAGRDQRSGSTGRTLAAAGVYARSVSFTLVSLRLHRPLFFIRNEQAHRLASDMQGSKLEWITRYKLSIRIESPTLGVTIVHMPGTA
jgi:hypothetical protein